MAYYNVCPFCGSSLDPGEKCGCREEADRRKEIFEKNLKIELGGQFAFAFDGMREAGSV